MNAVGHEASNPVITEGRSLPWLQDIDANQDEASDNWLTSWPYEYRDAVLVDSQNHYISAYNLTTHNLANAENFETLKSMIVDAARDQITQPWTNALEPYDVSKDTFVSAIDALLVLNELNGPRGARQLDQVQDDPTVIKPIDTNQDGFVSARDALLIINYINEYPATPPTVAAVAATPNAIAEAESFQSSRTAEPVSLGPSQPVADLATSGSTATSSDATKAAALDRRRLAAAIDRVWADESEAQF